MENNKKGYKELSAKMDETAKNELNARVEALSKKANAAFHAPGAPAGQEILLNKVSVTPYFTGTEK